MTQKNHRAADLDKALRQIRADQAASAVIARNQQRKKELAEKADAERRLRVAIWIGYYLQTNPLPPRHLAR